MSNLYGIDFSNQIRNGVIQSAEIIVPVIMDIVKPKSVLDIGGGEGWWAQEFKNYGCSVKGVDGKYVTISPLGEDFIAADITKSLQWLAPADLVVCLEVAEHLEAKYAVSFVADLSALAPTILWSAAIPRQPGVNHVHCQWPTFWQNLFAEHGKVMSGKIRDQFWNDDRIEPWYCVPEEAEILTREGWKTLGELRGDEIVLTSDPLNKAEWQPLTGLNIFEYSGEMIKVSDRWLSTPDHRWPCYKQGNKNNHIGEYIIRLASELASGDRIIQVADGYDAGQMSILNERDAAILGWIVTDGSLRHRSGLSPQAVIYQSPKKHLQEIVDLLGDEATSVKIDNRPSSYGCATVRVRSTVMERLAIAGFRSKEDLMNLVTRLNQSSAQAMWDAMFLAEGTINKSVSGGYQSKRFAQNPGPVLDAFQFLSFILGHRLNIKGEVHSVGGTGNGTKTPRTVQAKPTKVLDYNGKVWCPTTPNGTWIMRQNGSVCVTGNCQNLMVVTSTPEEYPTLFPDDTVLNRVHPIIESWWK